MDGASEMGTPERGEGPADRSGHLQKWADAHQFSAEPQPEAARRGPVVTLLNATPDPLGSLAALTGIYSGRVVRSLTEVTDDDRRRALEAMQRTALSGPLEVAQFHFLIEGVNRAFTHQLVRGRNAFYAQESLRFAVVEDWAADIPLPPYLAQLGEDHVLSRMYRQGLIQAEDRYTALVGAGMPAEEARELLPHAVLTRIHWVCDLRELLHVAGLRTCTQAQFVWRQVMAGVAQALRNCKHDTRGPKPWPEKEDGWQFEAIADAIRPVCYQTGRCGFMAAFDRSCTIRGRVEANASVGRPSSKWDTEYDLVQGNPAVAGVGPHSVVREEYGRVVFIGAIHPSEWAADPNAARLRPGE